MQNAKYNTFHRKSNLTYIYLHAIGVIVQRDNK